MNWDVNSKRKKLTRSKWSARIKRWNRIKLMRFLRSKWCKVIVLQWIIDSNRNTIQFCSNCAVIRDIADARTRKTPSVVSRFGCFRTIRLWSTSFCIASPFDRGITWTYFQTKRIWTSCLPVNIYIWIHFARSALISVVCNRYIRQSSSIHRLSSSQERTNLYIHIKAAMLDYSRRWWLRCFIFRTHTQTHWSWQGAIERKNRTTAEQQQLVEPESAFTITWHFALMEWPMGWYHLQVLVEERRWAEIDNLKLSIRPLSPTSPH